MADRPGARLKAARKQQKRDSDGEDWSVDDFLAAIKAATGWLPAYANYLSTERGETQPKAETWAKYVAFYDTLGLDLDAIELPEEPAPAAPMDVPSALSALTRAWEAEREEQDSRLRALEAEVQSLRDQLAAAMSAKPRAPRGSTG